MQSILSSHPEEHSGLSLESVNFNQAEDAGTRALTQVTDRLELVSLTLESLVKLTTSAHIIETSIDRDELTNTGFIVDLLAISTEADTLLGYDNDLTPDLREIIAMCDEDISTASAAYSRKRVVGIDKLINMVYSALDNLTSKDSWRTVSDATEHLFTNEKARLDTLKAYRAELKSGKRVPKDKPVIPVDMRYKLGVYSGRNDKFTFKLEDEWLTEYYSLFRNGVYSDATADVHDSLVQSVDNEVTLPVHKASLKYVENFERIDLTDILVRDSKIAVPGNPVGNVIDILSIVQDRSRGINYESIHSRVPVGLYSEIKVGSNTSKDIIHLIDTITNETAFMRSIVEPNNNRRLVADLVKAIRSSIATSLYSMAFGVLALRRLVRQYLLAIKYLSSVTALTMRTYSDWTNIVDMNIQLINELTELRAT